jgi:hypothetical protein
MMFATRDLLLGFFAVTGKVTQLPRGAVAIRQIGSSVFMESSARLAG